MHIRSATPGDVETIAALHAASWRTAYRGLLPPAFLAGPVDEDRRRTWAARLATTAADRPYVALAEEDAGVVGFACLVEQPPGAVLLDNLHVRPERRGTGVGRSLLHHSFDWVLANRPGSRLFLWVFAANSAAIRFYEREGGVRGRRRMERFDAGFEVEEVEYWWSPEALGTPGAGGSRR